MVVILTSSSSVRSNCFLSRSVRVGASHNCLRSLPIASRLLRCSAAQRAWTKLFTPSKFCLSQFELTQLLLPLRFETACHQAVLGVDGVVPPFGALRLVVGPFNVQSPKACATAASICRLPTLRQKTPRPFSIPLLEQWYPGV